MTATLMRVDDAADRALDPYLRIRERDLVGRDGLFVAEGEVVVRVLAFESPYTIRSLLLEQRRVEAMRDVVEHVPADVPAYVVPQKVMDAVVGFHIHRGVLAIGDRGDALHPEALLLGSGAGVIVGLVGLANHDNVGGIFRNAAAFGARGVLVDAGTCDPL
jgi:tRNA G18 (ribose-2'-O)-methylase SpoU